MSQQPHSHITNVGVCGASLDEATGCLEEVIGIVSVQEGHGVQSQLLHASRDRIVDESPRGIGRAIFTVGASRQQDAAHDCLIALQPTDQRGQDQLLVSAAEASLIAIDQFDDGLTSADKTLSLDRLGD